MIWYTPSFNNNLIPTLPSYQEPSSIREVSIYKLLILEYKPIFRQYNLSRGGMSNGHEGQHQKNGLCQLSNGHLLLSFPPALKKIISQQEWNLGDRQYRDLNADLLFEQLQVVEAKTLWLDLNKKSAIIKEITPPFFPNLVNLYLGDNNIATLQALPLVKAPNLQKLFLNHNKITSIKPLRRVRFPGLLELNLKGNFIEQEWYILECNFCKLEKLQLDYPNPRQRIFQNPWFVKAQFRHSVAISSAKYKLPECTLKMFLTFKEDHSRNQPRNLFKTFQN